MTEETQKDQPFEEFVERQRKAFEEAGKAIEALIPPEFKEHSKNAINESIEGFRVLVNWLVDEVKDEVKGDDKGDTPPAGKVKIEVT